ncbi:HNH endonuclease [Xanthobacter versatilis]|uniref:HNH endonuclease n=1 Tax=Xanthobacter autotrophicus (strain ATCC BAA-1158 / Py2) TaxID=78245 RepID=UPI00372A0344
MKKLALPPISFPDALVVTISGIASVPTQNMHKSAFLDSVSIEAGYADRARAATLYQLPRVSGSDDPAIHGALRRSHLTNLYTQYFVPASKPGRRIYEAIKVTANGKCPLCGGIGHVRTLDHYLPKANFPLYSVLPINLVPCCRDCNSDKLNAFSVDREGQTLHPYFDDSKFFDERWIHARVQQSDPPVIEFFVEPPSNWPADDRARAQAHFNDYRLKDKFSIEAAADLPETIQTRRTTMSNNTPNEFSDYLAEKGQTETLPINNWRRVMFSALALDSWFCSHIFV